ncbi:sensor histidine kinase [Microbacterium sp. ZW T5_56]|uniref:sensor histidine kinase n=1 Tax=Microbacterium sp. ZW T5_56 TaxID=3378081 RepID=UPI0038550E78
MTNPEPGAKTHTSPWERWGWLMAVVWMVFLIYPALSLISSPAPSAWIIAGWAATITFAVVYVLGFVAGMRTAWGPSGRTAIVLFGVQIVCALITLPAIETQVLSFVPYLMAYGTYALRGLWHPITTVSAVLIAVLITAVSGRVLEHLQILAVVLLMAAINSVTSWLIGRSIASDKVRLELAASDERVSIARDVHDLLGHTLTAVKLKAELAERLIAADPDRARRELTQIVALSTEAIQGVRATATGLRGTRLDEQIRESTATLESAGVSVSVTGEATTLSPAQAIPAAWILRESTTNIVRHAHADSVHIHIEPGVLRVEDNGRGVREPAGNGVRGMHERATAAGALLTVEEAPTGGTRVGVVW